MLEEQGETYKLSCPVDSYIDKQVLAGQLR